MAVSGSGLFCATLVDVLDATQLAIDMSLTTNKVALFTNSISPNYTTDTAYAVAPYNANECSGTGYTAGGLAVASPTLNASAGIITFDLADPSWASSTITNARCMLMYSNALSPKAAISLTDFGADYSTSNGTFLVSINAAGLWTLDAVP
jgi:hypothetical protein